MQLPAKMLRIGRVLHEDDDFLTIEVPKDDQRQLRVEDGDKFLTFIFVKRDPEDGAMGVWIPWEDQQE